MKTKLIIFVAVLAIAFGFACGSAYELHHSKSIDKQHEEIILENNYIYCPYCGERISDK